MSDVKKFMDLSHLDACVKDAIKDYGIEPVLDIVDRHLKNDSKEKFIQAKDDVCEVPEHQIVVLGHIVDVKEDVNLDEFYCPTCNKFWREN